MIIYVRYRFKSTTHWKQCTKWSQWNSGLRNTYPTTTQDLQLVPSPILQVCYTSPILVLTWGPAIDPDWVFYDLVSLYENIINATFEPHKRSVEIFWYVVIVYANANGCVNALIYLFEDTSNWIKLKKYYDWSNAKELLRNKHCAQIRIGSV